MSHGELASSEHLDSDPVEQARRLVALATGLAARVRTVRRLDAAVDRKAALYVTTLARHAARLLQSTPDHDIPVLRPAEGRSPGGDTSHYVLRHDRLAGPPAARRLLIVGSDARLRCCVVAEQGGPRIWVDYDVSAPPADLGIEAIFEALAAVISKLEEAVEKTERKHRAKAWAVDGAIERTKRQVASAMPNQPAPRPEPVPPPWKPPRPPRNLPTPAAAVAAASSVPTETPADTVAAAVSVAAQTAAETAAAAVPVAAVTPADDDFSPAEQAVAAAARVAPAVVAPAVVAPAVVAPAVVAPAAAAPAEPMPAPTPVTADSPPPTPETAAPAELGVDAEPAGIEDLFGASTSIEATATADAEEVQTASGDNTDPSTDDDAAAARRRRLFARLR